MSGKGARKGSAVDDEMHGQTNYLEHGIASLLSSGDNVEILECDKSGNIQQRWLHKPNGTIVPIHPNADSRRSFLQSIRGWRKALVDAFLPVGFPHSVSKDYLAYQFYDSLQAFFSTITSLLANRALLKGLGVGDANSSATFAMLLTILQDAMSRIATILFAQRFGLRIEPDAKRYRFLADLFNDTAFFIELYSPHLGPYGKMAALSASQALRALCGVSAGASKAALSVHFAKHDNLAELNAKEASQETAVGLIGLLVGTLVVKVVEEHRSVVCLMVILVLGHLWVNYLGVCSVHMTTLNRQRATILFSEYLDTGTVLSPSQVAGRENILFWDSRIKNHGGDVVARIDFTESYKRAMDRHNADTEVFGVDGRMRTEFISRRRGEDLTNISILLHDRAGPIIAIIAWFHSMEMSWLMEKGKGYSAALQRMILEDGYQLQPSSGDGPHEKRRFERKYSCPELWEEMTTLGWNLNAQAFETGAPVRLRIQPGARKNL